MYSISDYGEMIVDHARMDPYVYALKESVRLGSVVLDIGTGAGIHALLACKFGARKVYAVEPNDAIHLAKDLARENGFGDRIEFFQDLSTHITLPEPADVIVSDLRGVLPLYGDHIPAIIDARRRHLKPGGQLIPMQDTIWISLVEARQVYEGIIEPWALPYGLRMQGAARKALNTFCEEAVTTFRKSSFLASPQKLIDIEYSTVNDPDLKLTQVSQTLTRSGTAHGVLLWFDTLVADGIDVSNDPRQAKPPEVYGCGFFPLQEPVPVEEGDECRLAVQATLRDGYYIWGWKTQIVGATDRQTLKANFEQWTD